MYPQPHIGLGNGFDEQAKMLSDNGRIIVLAVPGDKKVAVYSFNGSAHSFRAMHKGHNPTISDDGFYIALSDCMSQPFNVTTFGRKEDSIFY